MLSRTRTRTFAGIGSRKPLTGGATSYGMERIPRSGTHWPNLYEVSFVQNGSPWQLETSAAASIDRTIDCTMLFGDKSNTIALGGVVIPAANVSPWLRQQIRPYRRAYPYSWDFMIRFYVQNQDVGKYGQFLYCYPELFVSSVSYGAPNIPTSIAAMKQTEGIRYKRITTHGTPSNAAWSPQFMKAHVDLRRLVTAAGIDSNAIEAKRPYTAFADGISTQDVNTGVSGMTVRFHIGIISIGSAINTLNHYWTVDCINHYCFTDPVRAPLT